jgi:hypothetical protein
VSPAARANILLSAKAIHARSARLSVLGVRHNAEEESTSATGASGSRVVGETRQNIASVTIKVNLNNASRASTALAGAANAVTVVTANSNKTNFSVVAVCEYEGDSKGLPALLCWMDKVKCGEHVSSLTGQSSVESVFDLLS